MKDRNYWLSAAASNSLMSFALCLLFSLAAQADQSPGLAPESASLDMVKKTDTQTGTPSPNTMTLYGLVKKHQTELDATAGTDASANATEALKGTNNDAKLQSERAANAEQSLFALAIRKLAEGAELSSDEYRSLGVGCVGFESNRTFFQSVGRVIAVYRHSPAEQAGIRKGDRMVSDDKDEEAKANPQQPRFQVTFAQAGTLAEVTILRHGHPVIYSLSRMNIEDIEEPEIRQKWEKIVRDLGFPKGGTFTGTSLQNLQFSPNMGTEKL